jgi:hypothetical protein
MSCKVRLFVLVLVLIPALSFGAKIQNDFDNAVDFSNYTTYAWVKGTAVANATLHDRIVNAVEGELSKRWLRGIQANPDLYVIYHGSAKREVVIDMSSFGYTYRSSWLWGGKIGRSDTGIQTYPQGTLVVDIWEAKTRRLIWRGVATDSVTTEPARSLDAINSGLQKMFLKYPPPKR